VEKSVNLPAKEIFAPADKTNGTTCEASMKLAILFLAMFSIPAAFGRSYVIFNMTQDIHMGHENEQIRKNYYVNLGSTQGVKKNSILDVFRIISVQNPYDNKKRINYRVKIGELRVVHTTEDAAITMVKTYLSPEESPVFEIPQFMIGDHVSINVD
jgi:hypothetical protein